MNRLVIIGTVWPEPNSTAAGSRMLQLISLFQKQNYNITASDINDFGKEYFGKKNIPYVEVDLTKESDFDNQF